MIRQNLFFIGMTLFFSSCNTGYEEKDGKIYLHTIDESVGHRYTEVVGADPATFEELKTSGSAYMGKDNTHVYHDTRILKEADPNTFEFIGDWYYKDQQFVYFFGFYNDINQCQLDGADPSTFKRYSKYPWGHDATNVFWATRPVQTTDPKTFKPLNKHWGKTQSHVIYKDSVIQVIDYASLRILNDNYALDKHNVYYGPEIVEGCDHQKFEPVSEITAHDGTYFYFGAERKGELTAGQRKLFGVK